MRAISIRCPECGARLSVSPDALESECSYCGSKSQIQRRTGFFERVEPSARRGRGGNQLPIATQRHSTGWMVALIGIPILLIVAGIPIVANERAKRRARATLALSAANARTSEAPVQVKPPKQPELQWISGGAAIADVNGDGTLDVLGRIVLSTSASQIARLAAFNGANGEPLWMSDVLALDPDDAPGPFVISGDTLVFPQSGATLRAFGMGDGAPQWTASLPEKLARACRGQAEGSVAIQTADKQWHALRLADGNLSALAWEGPCLSLESDSAFASRAGQLHIDAPFRYGEMSLGTAEGLRAGAGIFDTRSKVAIALATKHPGSAVPMLARYQHEEWDARILEGDLKIMRIETPPELRKELDRKWYAAGKKLPKSKAKLLWSAAIPSGDPLKAKEGAPAPSHVALQEEVVVAAYESRRGDQALTAFNVADGTRLWEIKISGIAALLQVVASPDHVFIIRRSGLTVVGLRDGKAAYSIP